VILGDVSKALVDGPRPGRDTMAKGAPDLAWAFGYNLGDALPLAAGLLSARSGLLLSPSVGRPLDGHQFDHGGANALSLHGRR